MPQAKPAAPQPGPQPGPAPAANPAPKPAPAPAPGPAAKPAPAAKPGAKPAPPTITKGFTAKMRHYGLFGSFVAAVVVPTLAAISYLYVVAEDQYTSTVGFAVRSEEVSSALGLLGGLSGSLSGMSSSDTDILYRFVRSQQLVRQIDSELDLRAIYAKPAFDPVFAFDPQGSIEELTDYWSRMVKVFYDGGTGLIELRVHAFDPRDAQRIARAVFDDSAQMINDLSAIAREDATRYAREELTLATERLTTARVALTQFRSRTQIVDPTADLQGQMGLVNSLQQQQAQAMIEFNVLRQTAREGDPRIAETERRIAIIAGMIEGERMKVGMGAAGGEGENYSTLVGEFERLTVEREFAERAHLAALTSYDNASAEAQRKSRYLAAYIEPTLAQDPRYPERALLGGLVFGFALLIWAIGALVYYSVRDRR